jgi:hypothetical protein
VMGTNRRSKHAATCHYCGLVLTAGQKTWDHIVPKSLGGPGFSWNLVTACWECNNEKANSTDRRYHCDRCVFAWRVFETAPWEVWVRPDLLLDTAAYGVRAARRGRRKRYVPEPYQYDPGR